MGLAVAAIAALGLAWVRAEGDAPSLLSDEDARDALDVLVGADGREITFAISDAGSGVRSVVAVLIHARGEDTLVETTYPGSWLFGGESGQSFEFAAVIDPAEQKLRDGDAILSVEVRDWSWRENSMREEISVRVDTTPPRVTVDTGLSYVKRGGSGSVRYEVSEPTAFDGVQVGPVDAEGSAFFRGFPVDSSDGSTRGARIAIFAVPTDAPHQADIRVVARDTAGNFATAGWPIVLKERTLPQGQVTLHKKFLDDKVTPLARADRIPTDDLSAAFHLVNTQLRSSNEKTLRAATRDTAGKALFRGAFHQLRNSMVTSRFGEDRRYFIGTKHVSRATHFGYDLAATARAPITASNDGRVVYSGELGIYGECIVIDHGLGVASLYGHLSQRDAPVGVSVRKDEKLGLSGATGLAGGDHLHFAMLVGETYVDPVEWWDPKWVKSHIEVRLPAPSP